MAITSRDSAIGCACLGLGPCWILDPGRISMIAITLILDPILLIITFPALTSLLPAPDSASPRSRGCM
ncbi:hypothetical protein BJX70DRAFT_85020 [Aspergillus crustosus]